jgi:hypothetical protein
VAASFHGDTPYFGKPVTSVPVTPYTTSVDVSMRFTSFLPAISKDALKKISAEIRS